MQSSSEQSLVEEERYVTAAKETVLCIEQLYFRPFIVVLF